MQLYNSPGVEKPSRTILYNRSVKILVLLSVIESISMDVKSGLHSVNYGGQNSSVQAYVVYNTKEGRQKRTFTYRISQPVSVTIEMICS